MNVEFQIKNNLFIKASPTVKHFKVIERTNKKLLMRVLNKCHSIPYADCFGVEEEWYCETPADNPNAKCCVLRITLGVIFYKSTMMKGMIQSNAKQEGTAFWNDWHTGQIKENGLVFKEKKKPKATGGTKKYQIESAQVLQRKRDRKKDKSKEQEEQKQAEGKKEFQVDMETAMEYGQMFLKWVQENPRDAMLLFCVLWIFRTHWKVSNIEWYARETYYQT